MGSSPSPWSRRRWLASGLGVAGALSLPRLSVAGGQLEEPLGDSVRLALSAAIANAAPPRPEFPTTDAKLHYLRWLGSMSDRLRKRKATLDERTEFLGTVWYETKRAGLDTQLVLGLIQVESAFRKFAVSPVGARGYMQVMPFWTRVVGDGDASRLFHMQTNLRYGCVILRHYLERERGDTYLALGRYNGSRGKPQYPNAVYAAAKNWAFDNVPVPVERSPDPGKPAADKAVGGPN